SVAINLNGGNFTFLGNETQNVSQSMGTVTLGTGLSTITMQSGSLAGGGAATILAGTLSRSGLGAAVNFLGVNTAIGSTSNQFQFAVAPTLSTPDSNGIMPYAIVSNADDGIDLVTLDGSNGITRFTNYDASFDINNPASPGGSNFKLTSSQ